jgi:hypothetical protein
MSRLARTLFVVFAERGDRIASSAPDARTPPNGRNMKKARSIPETSMDRYDWSRSTGGRYAKRFPADAHAVIDPALWPSFGSADAVNEALRAAVEVAKAVRPARGRRKSAA